MLGKKGCSHGRLRKCELLVSSSSRVWLCVSKALNAYLFSLSNSNLNYTHKIYQQDISHENNQVSIARLKYKNVCLLQSSRCQWKMGALLNAQQQRVYLNK